MLAERFEALAYVLGLRYPAGPVPPASPRRHAATPEERFAPFPKSAIRKVRALAAKGQLNDLAKRVLVARSLDELGLR